MPLLRVGHPAGRRHAGASMPAPAARGSRTAPAEIHEVEAPAARCEDVGGKPSSRAATRSAHHGARRHPPPAGGCSLQRRGAGRAGRPGACPRDAFARWPDDAPSQVAFTPAACAERCAGGAVEGRISRRRRRPGIWMMKPADGIVLLGSSADVDDPAQEAFLNVIAEMGAGEGSPDAAETSSPSCGTCAWAARALFDALRPPCVAPPGAQGRALISSTRSRQRCRCSGTPPRPSRPRTGSPGSSPGPPTH